MVARRLDQRCPHADRTGKNRYGDVGPNRIRPPLPPARACTTFCFWAMAIRSDKNRVVDVWEDSTRFVTAERRDAYLLQEAPRSVVENAAGWGHPVVARCRNALARHVINQRRARMTRVVRNSPTSLSPRSCQRLGTAGWTSRFVMATTLLRARSSKRGAFTSDPVRDTSLWRPCGVCR